MLRFIVASAAALIALPAAAQSGQSSTPTPEVVDMKPDQPGGFVLFGNVPWNDRGNQMPLATVEGVSDGRLEVTTLAVVDPATGAGSIRRVISNTPIPDSIESRATFGGPISRAGRATTPRPGEVEAPRMARR